MLSLEASNEKTREMIFAIEPSCDLYFVKEELAKTGRAFDLALKFGSPSFSSFKDMTGIVKRAMAGANLSLKELLEVGKMLSQVRTLVAWYEDVTEKNDLSAEEDRVIYLLTSLIPNKYLYERITDSILSEDALADSASSELASIRRKISNSGAKIKERLDKMIKSEETSQYLQENIVTMRDGRYVVPVKSQHKNNVSGLVHDTSATGATYFIEPMAIVEANNEIRILMGKEQEEIERIIAELSGLCAEFGDNLLLNFNNCAELNFYFAKARLGVKMNGNLPRVSDDGEVFLEKARHPLIDPKVVVPIDVNVGINFDALVITGPNTGGKTVILKTVGLLTLMAMCGLLIPAGEESRISVFENILVDIGDRQSIEQSLSTFSSHMNRVIDVLDRCNHSSLVLLDELGSGTDPVEGSALAVAIIENIIGNGSKLVTTTHYQELKMFAIDTENVENASCEFDVKTLMPTYRLIIGSPGRSNAFAISEKLGLPHRIIERAQSLVSDENREFEIIMEGLEEKRLEFEKLSKDAKILFEKAESEREIVKTELDKIEKTKETTLDMARREASRLVETVQRQSNAIMDELDQIRKEKNKENFSQNVASAKSSLNGKMNNLYLEANPVTERKNDYVLPRALIKGDTVVLIDTGKEATVTTLPDSQGNLFVTMGIMKTKINVSKIKLAEKEKVTFKGDKPKQKPVSKVSRNGVESRMTRQATLELDIRGYASDEGIMEVDSFIDGAVMSGLHLVTIIHGKGTGVLRNAVQQHLKRHKQVKSFRKGVYGEGEDGVTIVELK